jgi:hypothetical protein
MDRDLGMNMNLDGTESGLGTDFETHGTVAGKEKSLLSSSTEISPATNDGSTDFYLDGMQLASITYPLNSILKKSYQIAPVNLSATAVNVPVGPLIVSAKAGVSVEAKVDAEITPYAGIPLDQSYIELKLDPVIRAQAYTEGIATLLVVRGGIRGAVTLIDANLRMLSQVRFNQERPHVAMHGNLEFLSGELYGFAEVFSVLGWDWARFWKASFFEWAGKCYQFEQNREVAGACPSHD